MPFKDKKKQREYIKQYQLDNVETILERSKKWVELNKDRTVKNKAQFYQKNKEKIQRRSRQYSETLNGKFYRCKNCAKKRKIPFDLTLQDIESMPLICYYTGKPLTLKTNSYYTVSLDRLDSSKGYTKDNVVLCCAFINAMKNVLTYDQFILACKAIANYHDEKHGLI